MLSSLSNLFCCTKRRKKEENIIISSKIPNSFPIIHKLESKNKSTIESSSTSPLFCIKSIDLTSTEITNQKIYEVENGLKPGVIIDKKELQTKNIIRRMEDLHVPNVSVTIVNHNKIEWSKTYNIKSEPSIHTCSLFQAASISKPVAAFLFLKYVQEDYFSLDENVNKYLSTWKITEDHYTTRNEVTLAGLLSHTAGIGVHGFNGYSSSKLENELPCLIDILNGDPPANSPPIKVIDYPSTRHSYSGGGYLIAQKMLEDVTGKKFSDLAQKFILNPLGMDSSSFHLYYPTEIYTSIAQPYTDDGKSIGKTGNIYPESAAAGLWTNPSDLAKFIIEIQLSYEGKSNKILSQEMTKKMLTQQSYSRHGLGPEVTNYSDGIIEFQHSGRNAGFNCYMVGFTNGQGAVIMTNSNNGGKLLQEIVRSIADAYAWHDGYTFQYQIVHTIPTNPIIAQKIVGRFLLINESPSSLVIKIIYENGKIYFNVEGREDTSELNTESNTSFFNQENGKIIRFLDENYTEFKLLSPSPITAKKIA